MLALHCGSMQWGLAPGQQVEGKCRRSTSVAHASEGQHKRMLMQSGSTGEEEPSKLRVTDGHLVQQIQSQ